MEVQLRRMLAYRQLSLQVPGRPISKIFTAYRVMDLPTESQHCCSVIVVDPIESTLGKLEVVKLLELTADVAHLLIITNNLSTQGLGVLHGLSTTKRIEILTSGDILLDKYNNRLVPRYKVLSESEIQYLEQRLKLKRTQFPIMCKHDAMSKYLGFTVGQVVGAMELQTYRYVQ